MILHIPLWSQWCNSVSDGENGGDVSFLKWIGITCDQWARPTATHRNSEPICRSGNFSNIRFVKCVLEHFHGVHQSNLLFSFHLQIIRALIRSLKKTLTSASTQITPYRQFYSLGFNFALRKLVEVVRINGILFQFRNENSTLRFCSSLFHLLLL